MNERIIYFDNAATSFPKPQSVISAVVECMESYCGNPGRGSHPIAMRSAEKVYMAREALSDMFGAEPENVVFTCNTTYALNMAIKGVMSRGGHLLISNLEHNSTLRPIAKLSKEGRISYSIFDCYGQGGNISTKDILTNILRKLRQDTKMLVCLHSSNICSYSLPIREIGKLCRRHGILFCVDAAQSAGHIPINMKDDFIDILCLPAHKGLLSPQGCGIMMMQSGLTLDTLAEGGNGVASLETHMGTDSPERYESGTLCTPAIAGLCAGLEFIKSIGIQTVADHECRLWQVAYGLLSSVKGVFIHDKTPGSVLLFSIDGLDADLVGKMLGEKGFCLRTGYHCSALAHKTLNTPSGGAVRIGFGIFNTEEQVHLLCNAVKSIASDKSARN